MTNIEVTINKLFKTYNNLGVVGFGSFNWDYIVKNKFDEKNGTAIKLQDMTGFSVINTNGDELLRIKGPFIPDSIKDQPPDYRLIVDDKHYSGKDAPLYLEKFVLGTDVIKRAGGGITNLTEAFVNQAQNIPMGIVVYRGKGLTNIIVDGCHHHFIELKQERDQENLIFQGKGVRTIIRSDKIIEPANVNYQYKFDFKPGTIVIDSLSSKKLVEIGLQLYDSQRASNANMKGLIAVTPSMKDSFKIISEQAMPNGFIPIFNPVDLVKYAYKNEIDNPVHKKNEEQITYSEIFFAIDKIRKEQNGNFRRIYVTLGNYGSLGIDKDGTIYRTGIFKTTGKNKTGAGDVFASSVVRFEHDGLNVPIYTVMAYSSAASAIHIDGKKTYLNEITDKMKKEKILKFELIGNIKTMDIKSAKHDVTLGELGIKPISGHYENLIFR